jgi:hypothetical protein
VNHVTNYSEPLTNNRMKLYYDAAMSSFLFVYILYINLDTFAGFTKAARIWSFLINLDYVLIWH